MAQKHLRNSSAQGTPCPLALTRSHWVPADHAGAPARPASQANGQNETAAWAGTKDERQSLSLNPHYRTATTAGRFLPSAGAPALGSDPAERPHACSFLYSVTPNSLYPGQFTFGSSRTPEILLHHPFTWEGRAVVERQPRRATNTQGPAAEPGSGGRRTHGRSTLGLSGTLACPLPPADSRKDTQHKRKP